jgi:hypothetical protein
VGFVADILPRNASILRLIAREPGVVTICAIRMQCTSRYCFRLVLRFSGQITSSKRIFVLRRSRMKKASISSKTKAACRPVIGYDRHLEMQLGNGS